MKVLMLFAIALSAVVVGCSMNVHHSGGSRNTGNTEQGRTQISLSGRDGIPVTGFYVQNEQRFAISNAVPWSLDGTGISQLEIRKVNPADTVVVSMRYNSEHTKVQNGETLGPGVRWMKVKVRNGFEIRTYSR